MADAAAPQRTGGIGAESTAFVGRRSDLVQVKELLFKARLVTLTGVAGVGKSRLAGQVTAQLRDAFPDGVWFVELAPLRDGGLLPHTVAMALETPGRTPLGPLEDLTDFMRDKTLLLVLDNCEHVLDTCAEVAGTLLRAAPGLRVLATSRQPLGIMGEHVWPVPPLPTPVEALLPTPDEDYPALALFAKRAATMLPGFAITTENRDIVAQICRELEGLPLGIELAAARLVTLSLDQLLIGLHDRYGLLYAEPGSMQERHQTMRGAIAWSYELCSPAEQQMWQRLSVFPAGFDLDTAEQVCGGDGVPTEAVFELVTGLLDKSVLSREEGFGRVHYRLLDTVRQYGLDKLRAAGQEIALRRRHRDWTLLIAERAAAEWFGPHQAELVAQVRAEHANVRAALEFSLSTPGETRTGLSMAANLWFYWMACGLLAEGRYWLNRALRVNPEPSEDRAKAVWSSGSIAAFQGDPASAATMGEECRAYARQWQDEAAMARGTQLLGVSALLGDDLPRATAVLSEASDRLAAELAKYPHDSDLDSIALLARIELATTLTFQGAPDDGAGICDECRTFCEEHGERWVLSYALYVLALAEWASNRLAEAAVHAREALGIKRIFHDLLGIVVSVDLLAWIAAAEGASERAAVLLGAAHHMWGLFGRLRFGSRTWASPHAVCEARCREDLGDRAFETAHHRGSELPIAHAVAYAIAE